MCNTRNAVYPSGLQLCLILYLSHAPNEEEEEEEEEELAHCNACICWKRITMKIIDI